MKCSVCGEAVDSSSVFVGNLPLFLARLKVERFALCPSCSQDVPLNIQQDPEYQARWKTFASKLIQARKRGATSLAFVPKAQ
jgi:hypothetical protein